MLSDHNTIEIEFNKTKQTAENHSNTWGVNNTLLHDQWVIKETMIKSKISWNLMRMNTQAIRNYETQ
jgi:hypothetical protein